MKKVNYWALSFITLLLINIIALLFLFKNNTKKELINLHNKNQEYKSQYIQNAKELKYLLEILLNNSDELKPLMIEYNNINNSEFEEAIRKKVVKLELQIDEIEDK